MDDLSCGRWRGRYDRWNVFERIFLGKNGAEKIALFLWIDMFFQSLREYDSENGNVFAVNLHAEMFDFEFSR